MVKSLGFHLNGTQVDWALLECLPQQAPSVISAGQSNLKNLTQLYKSLCAGHHLNWGVSICDGNHRPSQLPKRWPLIRPHPSCLVHPAVAAASWDWECGRFTDNDLHLWLSDDALHCSAATPGDSFHCRESRDGSIDQVFAKICRSIPHTINTIVIATEPNAGGQELLFESVAKKYKAIRIESTPQEHGANRAALGAAIFAQNPTRHGALTPVKKSSLDRIWLASVLLATSFSLFNFWINQTQQKSLLTTEQESSTQVADEMPRLRRLGELPLEIDRLLERRMATIDALDEILKHAPAQSLSHIELSSGIASREVHLRLTRSDNDKIKYTDLIETMKLNSSQHDPRVLIGRVSNQRNKF